jgi:hypothetical protein
MRCGRWRQVTLGRRAAAHKLPYGVKSEGAFWDRRRINGISVAIGARYVESLSMPNRFELEYIGRTAPASDAHRAIVAPGAASTP